MSSSAQADLGQVLVDFSMNGAFPEEEAVSAAHVNSPMVSAALAVLQNAKSALEVRTASLFLLSVFQLTLLPGRGPPNKSRDSPRCRPLDKTCEVHSKRYSKVSATLQQHCATSRSRRREKRSSAGEGNLCRLPRQGGYFQQSTNFCAAVSGRRQRDFEPGRAVGE